MKLLKNKFRFLTFFVLFIAAVITALFLVDKADYENYIASKIVAKIHESGAPIYTAPPKLFWFGLRFKDVSIRSNKPFMFFHLNDVEILPKLSSLLFSNPEGKFNATAYSGKIKGDFIESSTDFKTSFTADNVNIMQLGIPDIRSGILSANAKDLTLNLATGLPQEGSLDVSLQNGTIFLARYLPRKLTFDWSSLRELSIDVNCLFSNKRVKIKNITTNSSILEINGEGEIPLTPISNKRPAAFDGDISLAVLGFMSSLKLTKTEWYKKTLVPHAGNANFVFKKDKIDINEIFKEIPMKVPSIDNLVAGADLFFKEDTLEIDNLSIDSSLITFKGRGNIHFTGFVEPKLTLSGSLTLSDSILEIVTPSMIPLGLKNLGINVNEGKISPDSKELSLKFSGTIYNPVIDITSVAKPSSKK